jgi:hypothetical protein
VYLRGSSYSRSLRPLRLADESALLSKIIGIVQLGRAESVDVKVEVDYAKLAT